MRIGNYWKSSLFVVRLCLGFLFLLSGLSKIRQPYDFLADVYAYQMTGPLMTRWIAMLLPWLETVLGVCLLSGILLGGSLGAVSALAVVFAVAQATAISRGLSITCGCFESVLATDTVNYTSLARSCAICAAAAFGWTIWRKALPRVATVGLLLVMMIGLPVYAQLAPATKPARDLAPIDLPAILPAPPDSLKASAGSRVAAWLNAWQLQELQGKGATPTDVEKLGALLDECKTAALLRAQLAATVAYMDGDAIAKPLCIGAIEQAAAELAGISGGASQGTELARELWPVHDVLWRLEDYPADLGLVALALPWEKRGTAHSQWANFIHAELLMYNDRDEEAFHAFEDCVAERSAAREPAIGINRALDWELALSAFNAGRLNDALKHFDATAVQSGNGYAEPASASACMTLAAMGRADEARARLQQHAERFKLSTPAITALDKQIRDELGRSKQAVTAMPVK